MSQNIDKISPIYNFDEYDIFHKSILNLKEKNEIVFNSWLNKLSDGEKAILNNIMFVRRIEVTNKETIYKIPRKILRIKKNDI